MTKDQYTITHDGSRWWNFPYQVRRNGIHAGIAMTFRGAKMVVRQEKRKAKIGKKEVWSE